MQALINAGKMLTAAGVGAREAIALGVFFAGGETKGSSNEKGRQYGSSHGDDVVRCSG